MKPLSAPPKKYEDLTRIIHERHDGMSKTNRKIALHLTQNPNDVAVMSLNAIASDCGAHASSFVRFAQGLGYDGFSDLQVLFKHRLTTAAPGFEARQKALEQELSSNPDAKGGKYLSDLVIRDIASLQELLSNTATENLKEAAMAINAADTVFVIGQLRSGPVAELFRYVLTMLGKKVVILDASGGLATHMAKTMSSNDVLLAISFRFYANEVVNIVEEASRRGIQVVGISDSSLSPIAKSADPLFVVPEHGYTFSRSLAAPMCLAQAIMLSLAGIQQDGSDPRIPTVTAD